MSLVERIWAGRERDDGSIHVLGNGRICAYGQGPELIQIFGPPYSGPQWGSIVLPDDGITCRSRREAGTAIWHHTLSDGTGEFAAITDLAAAGTTAIVRLIKCSRPLRLGYRPRGNGARVVEDTAARLISGEGFSCQVLVPRGATYYSQFPFPDAGYACLRLLGPVRAQEVKDGFDFTLEGETLLLFAGGPDLPTAMQQAEECLALGFTELMARSRADWAAFCARRRPLSERELRLADTVDSVATLVRAQQGQSGGVLAGHNYHLAYVRDQYGVSRGLLELGHYAEARAIMDYYSAIWNTQGTIHNAQPIGMHSPFHVHEDDRSEVTGYLVNQAMDYVAATGDDTPMDTWQPMVDWAVDQQLAALVDGALPFNGDETYVAGGMMPRTFLDQSSAEATLLFIASTRRFADWTTRRNRWPPQRRQLVCRAVDGAATAFRRHFLVGDRLFANDPARATLGPRFRHGVCIRCGSREMRGVTWTERDANGNYQCPVCYSKGPLPAFERPRLEIASVALAPCFLGDGPLTDAEVNAQIRRIGDAWQNSGSLPSQAGREGGATVGYDYGFLLLGLDRIGHPGADALANATLGLLDQCGAWVEYYLNGKPSNTRCRPWESAIDLHACLKHARRNNAIGSCSRG